MDKQSLLELADGLTEAQINLLFYWPKGLFDEQVRRALVRKLLIDGRSVTPLGLEVRELLRARAQ